MKKNEENCIGGYNFKHGDYERPYLGVKIKQRPEVAEQTGLIWGKHCKQWEKQAQRP